MRIKLLLILSLFYPAFVLAESSPKEQTLAMIEALKQVKVNDETSYKKVDQYIDYQRLTSDSIAPQRSKFSDKQAKEFMALFSELIRKIAYPQSSTFYNDEKSEYQPTVITGDKALVVAESVIEKEDFEMEIGYQYTKTNGVWRLSDLFIDEDSLVKDYQNQFSRIILKEGVDGLIKKIKHKLKEIDAENSKK